MKVLQLVVTCLFIALMLVSPVSAASQGEAKGKEFPPPFLNGNRIGLYFSVYRKVPANQSSFVIHGFTNPNWKDLSGQGRNSALTDYSFALEIDGIAVKLRKWTHYDKSNGDLEDLMSVYFYVQFEANQFAVGTYAFRGIWYGPDMTVLYESFVTVHFF